jgi:hypothetical protein
MAFTLISPEASIANVRAVAMMLSAMASAPRCRDTSSVSNASRCIGIMIAGALSFCRNACGIITPAMAPRKPSATSEAPRTFAIEISRPKPGSLLASAPLIRMAVERRIVCLRSLIPPLGDQADA